VIKVNVGTNVERKEILIDESKTIRSVLKEQNIDYTRGTITLDGATLLAGDFDKTFADFKIKESCFLLKVAKADNG